MKTLLLSAAAIGALSLAAFGPANANPASPAVADQEEMLFQAAAGSGEAAASTEAPRYGKWGRPRRP